jgi:hypothetical protein
VYSHAHKHHASLNSADYPHRKIKASKSGERTHRHHQRGALIWSARLPIPPLFSPWYVRESNLAFGRGLESNLPPPPLPPLLMMNQLANQSRMCIRYTQQTHTYTGSHANLRGRTNKTKEMRDARAYTRQINAARQQLIPAKYNNVKETKRAHLRLQPDANLGCFQPSSREVFLFGVFA